MSCAAGRSSYSYPTYLISASRSHKYKSVYQQCSNGIRHFSVVTGHVIAGIEPSVTPCVEGTGMGMPTRTFEGKGLWDGDSAVDSGRAPVRGRLYCRVIRGSIHEVRPWPPGIRLGHLEGCPRCALVLVALPDPEGAGWRAECSWSGTLGAGAGRGPLDGDPVLGHAAGCSSTGWGHGRLGQASAPRGGLALRSGMATPEPRVVGSAKALLPCKLNGAVALPSPLEPPAPHWGCWGELTVGRTC